MRPDWVKPGTRVLNQWKLGAALTGEVKLDPPIQSLFVYNANPAVVAPEQEKVLQGLAREDLFTVVSEHFITDTARYADIVCPRPPRWSRRRSCSPGGISISPTTTAPSRPRSKRNRTLSCSGGLAKAADDPLRRDDAQMALEAMDWASLAMEGITMDVQRRLRPPESRHLIRMLRTRRATDAVGQSGAEGLMAAGGSSCRCSARAPTSSRTAPRWIRCRVSSHRRNRLTPMARSRPSIRSTSSRRRATRS
jgi:hypothetical protein